VTDRFAKNADAVSPAQARWFTRLTGIAAMAIIAQAAIAGEFNSHPGNAGWVLAHGLVSYVTLAATLAAAVFTLAQFRRTQQTVTILATGLFGLTVAQTIIGYLITVAGANILLVVHIPLAFVIFGLAGWLAVKAVAINGTKRRFRD
jgi:heme A synthase